MQSFNFDLYSPYPIELRQQVGIATVCRTITPERSGRVHFEATDWPARLYDPTLHQSLEPDALVHVIGRQGLTLLVTPKSRVAVPSSAQSLDYLSS
ncbi:hypothetical protein XM38_039390 [Halomicronema hongdechloris C2206]|uniref:NfeD-like C-terminal domain-containing protein n=1 Tax=Halomicronema hongdechloris C2206 TaxID=1641165 RepID=A0A1Z3HRR9_9CYAN|nr:NfeD family protein [Halomicronema hongdechloris]ASC72978.1 hypothetical protein XM38_039390 [Halomicronema hongdechloris C2206]